MSEKKKLTFWEDQAAKALLSWWNGLEENRGDRAVLRRAKEPYDVAMLEPYHRLLNKLGETYEVNAERLALVAGILAHVRKSESKEGSFAVQIALPKAGRGEGARVSGLRFRRLLACEDREDLYRELIRAVRLNGDKADIISLAHGAYSWNDYTRRKWALDYYSKATTEK